MKALIQRVSRASVTIGGTLHSRIGPGLVILLGIKTGDTERDAVYVAEKCCSLRIFEDDQEKMNLSVRDVGGSLLVVSQFTLYGDTRKGNRPSFIDAAPPEAAEPLYERFVAHARMLLGEERVSTGVFRAMMDVELVNSGPVTVTVESKM
ncbi:MAG TPA: D-aminoacyl-tRNA deacylase [Bacteroidota bacterium]|nr:D-aminoacyl-tRNA deacylase [Bacteroidota bacterium]